MLINFVIKIHLVENKQVSGYILSICRVYI